MPLLLLDLAWRRRDVLLALACVLLALGWRSAARRPAPPATTASAVRVNAKGPVRVTKRQTKTPEGLVTTETVTERAPEVTTTSSERTSTPVQAPQPWRYAGLELARDRHTALRLGVSLGPLELSARHELPYGGRLIFNPWVGVGYRW